MTITPKRSHFEAVNRSNVDEAQVILQPVVQRIPNRYHIYFPSKLESNQVISYQEFLYKYAPNPKGIRICFEEAPSLDTMLSRSKLITGYNFGLNCWYIVVSTGSGLE